jgi:hypothetical protein
LQKWLCPYKRILAPAFQRLLGKNVCLEVLNSRNFTGATVAHRQETEKLMKHLENEYNRMLDEAIKSIPIPNNDCFSCDTEIEYRFPGI